MKCFHFLVIIAFMISACDHDKLPFYQSADFTPLWEGESNFLADTLHSVAPFSFTDQDGNIVNKESLKGKVYVANFIFTSCPGICPKMTNNLKKVQETFAGDPDVLILSHSVMPWADSVPRLKAFSELHQLDDARWKLLTGNRNDIYELARTSYFAEEVAGFSRDSTDFIHTEHCLLVDANGHLRGLYNGTLVLEIDRLIEDLRVLRGNRR
jgi:protein SCO1